MDKGKRRVDIGWVAVASFSFFDAIGGLSVASSLPVFSFVAIYHSTANTDDYDDACAAPKNEEFLTNAVAATPTDGLRGTTGQCAEGNRHFGSGQPLRRRF